MWAALASYPGTRENKRGKITLLFPVYFRECGEGLESYFSPFIFASAGKAWVGKAWVRG